MNSKEHKVLNRYLNRSEKKLGHIDVQARLDVMAAVKEELLSLQQLHADQSLTDHIKRAEKGDELLNRELAKRGLPLVRSKKWWKIFLLSMLLIILGTILAIILAVKSFFPLVNVNDVDGTLELFGSHIVLEKDDADYFTKINDREFIQWKKTAKLASGTFDFGRDPLDHSLLITVKQGELAVRSHDSSEVRYTCYTEDQLQKIFSQQGKQYVMNLDAKKSHCLLFVPHLLPLGIRVERGNVNIKNMAQGFDVKVKEGIVYWRQKDRENFNLAKVDAPDIEGDRSGFSPRGQWMVNIWVDKGEVRLR